MKDRFSTVAGGYSRFRPQYPSEVYSFILPHVKLRQRVWDCGTGNGQVAAVLSSYFDEVFATDISEEQLKEAPLLPNVHYRREQAEQPSFPDAYFDMVIVAQAIHWFHFHRFYAAVRRTLKPGGLFVAMGYGLVEVDKKVDEVVRRLYVDVTGNYWDAERKYIDEGYRTIPFPFDELEVPHFWIRDIWKRDRLEGFLRTWSGVSRYNAATGGDAVSEISGALQAAWGNDEEREVRFPVLLRMGRVQGESGKW